MKTPRLLAALVALGLLLMASPAWAAPLSFPLREEVGFPDPGPGPVGAPSYILYDEMTGAVLTERAADEPRSIASTTKIMTALLAIENGDLDDTVVVGQAAEETIGQSLGLEAGEEIRLGALVKAALIFSANDAAAAIADHIGGSQDGFVELMNRRAEQLGMTDTQFANPHGIDTPGHYSTARDLLTLGRAALAIPEFAAIVASKGVVLGDAPDGTRRAVRATNRMLTTYEGMLGIKTGQTPRSGLTFVGSAQREGRRLFVVVLGAQSERGHFVAASRLLDYGFETLGIYTTLVTGAPYRSMKATPDPAPVVATARAAGLLHLASLGLLGDPPSPLVEGAEPDPPPVVEVRRQAERPESPVTDALLHWVRGMVGDG